MPNTKLKIQEKGFFYNFISIGVEKYILKNADKLIHTMTHAHTMTHIMIHTLTHKDTLTHSMTHTYIQNVTHKHNDNTHTQ